MDYRMVAFDLDDTLLDDHQKVSAIDAEAVKRAREAGLIIVPASGRRYNSMFDALEAIDHTGPVITLNGGQVVDYPSGRVLHSHSVDLESSVEIVRLAKEYGAYVQCYVGDDFEFEKDCKESRLYARLSGAGGGAVGDLEAYLRRVGLPSKKLLFIVLDDEERMQRLESAVHARFDGRMSVFRSKSFYLEVTNISATKGAALRNICEDVGIAPEAVIALGDGENDVSMLQYAGVGIAVDNAKQSVKDQVRYTTLSNVDNGVSHAIRKWVFGEATE
jgi:Cof subfamily protein (haloacid dehalogenase superfamily)